MQRIGEGLMSDVPIRCASCGGSGNGQTVITGNGSHTEPCSACGGTGRQ